jgi:hypothetical protein
MRDTWGLLLLLPPAAAAPFLLLLLLPRLDFFAIPRATFRHALLPPLLPQLLPAAGLLAARRAMAVKA